jgi:hypothetical protein
VSLTYLLGSVVINLYPLFVYAQSDPRVLWDLDSDKLRTRGVVQRTTSVEFQREALRLLEPDRIAIGTLSIFASKEDWVRAGPQSGSDCAYGGWRSALEIRGLIGRHIRCPEVSQAIKIGSAVAMRRVDRRCNVAYSHFGSRDPLHLNLQGDHTEVLDLVISIRSSGDKQKAIFSLAVFINADTVSTDIGRKVVQYMHDVSSIDYITVVVRSDRWFWTHCDFPPLSIFKGRVETIPSESELLKSKEIVCGTFAGRQIRCF